MSSGLKRRLAGSGGGAGANGADVPASALSSDPPSSSKPLLSGASAITVQVSDSHSAAAPTKQRAAAGPSRQVWFLALAATVLLAAVGLLVLARTSGGGAGGVSSAQPAASTPAAAEKAPQALSSARGSKRRARPTVQNHRHDEDEVDPPPPPPPPPPAHEPAGLAVGIGPKCTDAPFSNLSSVLPNPCDHCKFFTELHRPSVAPPCFIDADGAPHYGITMRETRQFSGLLDRDGQPIMTTVWAFGVDCEESWRERLPRYQASAALANKTVRVTSAAVIAAAGAGHHWPGPTIETESNVPVYVLWRNELPMRHIFEAELNDTRLQLHCGLFAPLCTPDVRTVVHMHGGHTLPQHDGHSNAWFTQSTPVDNLFVDRVRQHGGAGSLFTTRESYYQNDQEAAPLWVRLYPHTRMGITRLNVFAGLSGLWRIRDARERALEKSGVLPSGRFEVGLSLADRWFSLDNGQLDYNRFGEHEMYANYSMVNGIFHPIMHVLPTRYRLRLINNCNSRALNVNFQRDHPNEWKDDCWRHNRLNRSSDSEYRESDYGRRTKIEFCVVGADGGLLVEPACQFDLFFVIAERYDIVIDFAPFGGTNITMHNSAPAEFGAPWSCPPFCPPTFSSGIDRFMRFIVADAITHEVSTTASAADSFDATLPDASASRTERAAARSKQPETAITASTAPAAGTVDASSSAGSTATVTSHRDERVDLTDKPTSSVTSPFPARFRPFVYSGAVDRVRQMVLVETSFEVLHNGHPDHGDATIPHDVDVDAPEDPNAPHPPEPRGPPGHAHDGAYLLTVNDYRYHHGLTFHEETAEVLEACTTERWEIINLTNDTHAIHLHLIQFELIGRANFTWFAFGHNPTLNESTIMPAHPSERGPKDVFHVHPFTTLYIQGFFDRPGRFVWHCHMLEHEDVEMMHNLEVIPSHCSCITSPLLREANIVAAKNLPPPYNLRDEDDGASHVEVGTAAPKPTPDPHASTHSGVSAAGEPKRLRRGDKHDENDHHNDSDDEHGPTAQAAYFGAPSSTAAAEHPSHSTPGGALPAAPFPATGAPVAAAEYFDERPDSFVVRANLALRESLQRTQPESGINGLHATLCPGGGSRFTNENTPQSEELNLQRRIELAIEEIRTIQPRPPRPSSPPTGGSGDVHAHVQEIVYLTHGEGDPRFDGFNFGD